MGRGQQEPAADGARDRRTRLPDGRELAWAEYGAPDGIPLLLFHGLPGCRLSVPEIWATEPAGVRVIAPDRPGIGRSTFQPGRTLLNWGEDIRRLADLLGVERFLVAGVSAGGPYALAVASHLADRVTAVGSIAGSGPMDAGAGLKGMNRRNRVLFTMARRTPFLLRAPAAGSAYLMRTRPRSMVEAAARDRSLVEADRQVLRDRRFQDIETNAGPEVFRQGVRGFVEEIRLCVQPWGFDLEGVRPPVHLWHGACDGNVPLGMAEGLAARLPTARLTIFPGEGHLIVPTHWPEIVATLLAHAG